jgi:hypothetical protein
MKKSFFEYIGLADVERVHSQILSWLLSKDCEAFDSIEKTKFLKNIFGINENIIEIQTERDKIDILITTQNNVIVIENKLKSSQHSNQLIKYKDYCKNTFPNHKVHYFFLTLINEKTDDNEWNPITYSLILKKIKELTLNKNNHGLILNEYLIFLDKLVCAVEDFNLNYLNYKMVFLDGKKKKQDKICNDYETNNYEWFIASNQLETIFQKMFLNKFANELKIDNFYITETRGDALINFTLDDKIAYNSRCYSTFIQLQNDTIKFAFAISGIDYMTSEKDWVKDIIPKMEEIRDSNEFNYSNLNKPRSKAYISISKKMNPKYWEFNIEDLCIFIKNEIEYGKILTNLLIDKL